MQKVKNRPQKTRTIGVLLFERFSNHCLANAVEPLRVCNTVLGYRAYDWRFYTLDGAAVSSSSGLPVSPNDRLGNAGQGDVLFVLPSYGFRELADAATSRALRVAARDFHVLAGMDAGSWLLARAGLLEGKRATIHWEELEGFAETFPEVEVERRRYLRDGDRWTCAGATTAFDLVLAMIREDHGAVVALEVAGFLMHGATGADAPLPVFAPGSDDARVTAAVSIMRDNLEEPLSLPELSARMGMSPYQLKAAFTRSLSENPGQVYRRMRLSTARRLVEQGDASVAEIAVRCGYADAAAMTRAFRKEFGTTPRAMRQGRYFSD